MSADKVIPIESHARITVKADDLLADSGSWAQPRHANILQAVVPNLESWWAAFTKYHEGRK